MGVIINSTFVTMVHLEITTYSVVGNDRFWPVGKEPISAHLRPSGRYRTCLGKVT